VCAGFKVQEGVTTIPSAPLCDAGMWGERTASFIPLGTAEQDVAEAEGFAEVEEESAWMGCTEMLGKFWAGDWDSLCD
jgi:hypothetical protein